MTENDWTFEASDHVHPSQNEGRLQGKEKPVTLQRGQDYLKLLTTKALEALAQTPPGHHQGKAGGELAFETSNPQFYVFLSIEIKIKMIN